MRSKINIIIQKSFLIIIAITIASIAISLFYALNIGADPFSVLVDGEHNLLKLDYGTVTTINNIVLITFGLIFGRKYLKIGTLISAFLFGPLLNFFVPIFNSLITESIGFYVRFALLFPTVAILGFGVAMIISLDFGVGTVELLTLTIRDATKLKLRWVKMGLDLIFTVAGFLMGGIVGAGTIIGVFLTGPIIGLALPHLRMFVKWLKLVPTTE